MTKKSQHDEFEILEARLTLELKRHKDDKEGKPRREVPQRPPRDFLVCKLSCKKNDPAARPVTVTAEVETVSELLARIEAAKMARKMGYYPEECVELSLEKITK